MAKLSINKWIIAAVIVLIVWNMPEKKEAGEAHTQFLYYKDVYLAGGTISGLWNDASEWILPIPGELIVGTTKEANAQADINIDTDTHNYWGQTFYIEYETEMSGVMVELEGLQGVNPLLLSVYTASEGPTTYTLGSLIVSKELSQYSSMGRDKYFLETTGTLEPGYYAIVLQAQSKIEYRVYKYNGQDYLDGGAIRHYTSQGIQTGWSSAGTSDLIFGVYGTENIPPMTYLTGVSTHGVSEDSQTTTEDIVAQSFQLSQSSRINKIVLSLARDGDESRIKVAVREYLGGGIAGPILESRTINTLSLDTSVSDIGVIMPGSYIYNAGTTYLVTIQKMSGITGSGFIIQYAGEDYTSGMILYSFDDGSTWLEEPSDDYYFEIWGVPI